jgi:lipopolysaccharide-induced tumor necrosis factor-alpha factor
MMKDIEYHQQQQQAYPSQIPTAPPTYDEAMYTQAGRPQYQPPLPPQAVAPPPGFVPPAGSSYYPQQPPVIEVQRTIIALPLGPNSARIKCPQCHADVLTRTETEPSCAAHLCCLLLLLIGCCPCSSLPYFMDSLKNVRHSCPNCQVFLGTYQP